MNPSKSKQDGYLESEKYVITWCVGHLVTMSYPEKYDEKLKRWSLDSLPFIPEKYKYELIPSVKQQYKIVSSLLKRKDIETIYVCTDSGREGEYIYRLVEQQARIPKSRDRRRVWIDSQTKEEILRGIREARPESEYDRLSAAAFSRAKEDYLMGINFSRALTLRYGREISRKLGIEKNTVVAVGRVMTCVLGMIVKREQEIRAFQKTVYYKVQGSFSLAPSKGMGKTPELVDRGMGKTSESVDGGAKQVLGQQGQTYSPDLVERTALGEEKNEKLGLEMRFLAEFKAKEHSTRYTSAELYKDGGFLKREKAEAFVQSFMPLPQKASVSSVERKKEVKNPPLLYNLAELQNDCSRLFKISPEDCLKCVQELYEKKLSTYPRTDARVLSTAVAKEIEKNIRGLLRLPNLGEYAREILEKGAHKAIARTRYTDDKKITDHYAIIPTGQGLSELSRLNPLSQSIYELIARRFLSIFYPAAIYEKLSLTIEVDGENFQSSQRPLKDEGYLKVAWKGRDTKKKEEEVDRSVVSALLKLKKGQNLDLLELSIKEGETTPPKRYSSGSMILAMENAGKLIEDEDLREQIKSSGIGTSATRAGILSKLQKNGYISLNKKTQIMSPTKLGELITEVVYLSVRQLLNPELTASWEKGLSYVAEGKITEKEYMDKLNDFVRQKTERIKLMGR